MLLDLPSNQPARGGAQYRVPAAITGGAMGPAGGDEQQDRGRNAGEAQGQRESDADRWRQGGGLPPQV